MYKNYVGKMWKDISTKEQEHLMSISTIWDDVSEGECIVDFYEDLSISGFIVNNDTDTDYCRELVIDDESVFYNPQG